MKLFHMEAALISLLGYIAGLQLKKIMQKQFETNYSSTIRNFVAPIFFGVWIIFFWEVATVGLKIPVVILPSPSVIGIKFVASLDILWADFIQTFVKSALIGYLIGCSSGLLIAILIDSSPFLKRGLLPIGNFISACLLLEWLQLWLCGLVLIGVSSSCDYDFFPDACKYNNGFEH